MPLTFDRRIAFTYPSGLQTLHANFYSDDAGFYFASGGIVHAFDWDGSRNTSRDVTLTNAPAGETVWGFTERSDGGWVILTREAGTGTIGKVRTYTHAGAEELNFDLANSITSVAGETFRAPKSIAEHDNHYFIRVVRSVSGNMRFVKYTADGAPTNEDLTLASANPTSLSDFAESNGILFIIQQNQRIAYATDLDDASHQLISDLQTTLDSRNTSPFGASGGQNNLYVADRGGYVYVYSGVPVPRVPSTGGGGGFGIFSAAITEAIMSRNMNRRNRDLNRFGGR